MYLDAIAINKYSTLFQSLVPSTSTCHLTTRKKTASLHTSKFRHLPSPLLYKRTLAYVPPCPYQIIMSLTALQDSIKALISSLEAHEQFRGQQARQGGKIYFMWDFVKNTLRMLDMSQDSPERGSEAMQRCMFANILFNDPSGKLSLMCGGDTTEFSDDIKQKSADCEKKAGEWGVAQGLTPA